MSNFADVYAALDRAGGALAVADVQGLANALVTLLRDGPRMRAMARAAADTVEGLGGAVERTMAAVEPFLMQMTVGGR